MTKNAELGSIDGSCYPKDLMVKRLPFISKNLNKATGYLTSNTKQVFTQLRQMLY